MRTTRINLFGSTEWIEPMQRVLSVVEHLGAEERVVLWAMRVWVIGRHYEIDSAARIRNVLASVGAEEASAYLHEFMLALGTGAKRRIDIHCACHPQVESDECLLLDVLSLAQECRSLEALLLLRGLVRNKEAPSVLRCAQGLVMELAFAGQFLNAPSANTPVQLESPCPPVANASFTRTFH